MDITARKQAISSNTGRKGRRKVRYYSPDSQNFQPSKPLRNTDPGLGLVKSGNKGKTRAAGRKGRESQVPDHSTLSELNPKAGVDQASLTYTQLPVPAELTVKASKIPGAGLGVFANQLIPRNVKLGPLKGKRVEEKEAGKVSYAWEVKFDGEKPYLIDASDPSHSNWMRFVNCVKSEHNLAAFQSEGHIFYRTIKTIHPGSELLVWYTYHYAGDESGEPPHKYGKGFVSRSALVHSGEKPFKCEHCGMSFVASGSLKKHIQIHSGEKPYECEHCSKCFSRAYSLQRHHEIHSKAKKRRPHKCEQCGKGFASRSALIYHIRVHSGEKPFKCEHCGKCFIQKGQLQVHFRTHSGEKPYKCEVCGKSFVASNDLKKHLRIHSGEKPYECEHCSKCFSRADSLRKHREIHSKAKKEEPYKCEHCGWCFKTNDNLQCHLQLQHESDDPLLLC